MKSANTVTLGRPIDFAYKSNRYAVVGMFAAGALAFGYEFLFNDNADLLGALGGAIAAFLGWALGRELDPDHDWTAFLAMVFATAMAIWMVPALLLTGVALLGLRALVGTVRNHLTWIDNLLLTAAAGYAATTAEGWAVAGIVVVAVFVGTGEARAIWTAAVAVVALGVALIWPSAWGASFDSIGAPVAILILTAALVVFARPVTVGSTTDLGHQPIMPARLFWARVLATLCLGFSILAAGLYGIGALGPLAGAVVAAAISAALSGNEFASD